MNIQEDKIIEDNKNILDKDVINNLIESNIMKISKHIGDLCSYGKMLLLLQKKLNKLVLVNEKDFKTSIQKLVKLGYLECISNRYKYIP